MKINQIKEIYDATGMHPYEVDKGLLESDSQGLLKRDSRGNISGIDMSKYVEHLKKLIEPPIQSDGKIVDIQMMGPRGKWETFDIMKAHNFINEDGHYVILRMWKDNAYVMLNAHHLNSSLKDKAVDDMKNVCVLMPPVSSQEKKKVFRRMIGESI